MLGILVADVGEVADAAVVMTVLVPDVITDVDFGADTVCRTVFGFWYGAPGMIVGSNADRLDGRMPLADEPGLDRGRSWMLRALPGREGMASVWTA